MNRDSIGSNTILANLKAVHIARITLFTNYNYYTYTINAYNIMSIIPI